MIFEFASYLTLLTDLVNYQSTTLMTRTGLGRVINDAMTLSRIVYMAVSTKKKPGWSDTQ
jgi:hypothetical protein